MEEVHAIGKALCWVPPPRTVDVDAVLLKDRIIDEYLRNNLARFRCYRQMTFARLAKSGVYAN
jgi:hypothetical protein